MDQKTNCKRSEKLCKQLSEHLRHGKHPQQCRGHRPSGSRPRRRRPWPSPSCQSHQPHSANERPREQGVCLLFFKDSSRHRRRVGAIETSLEDALLIAFKNHVFMYKPPSAECARQGLARKPLHVPLGRALDVPDDHLESVKVQRRHCVETHVEKDERPLEEGVGGVG